MSELVDTHLLNWRELPPTERRDWWERLWIDTIALSDRYRLPLRSGWWEDAIQVEALGAFIAWVRLYDSGAYADPPGKLQLLWELERLRAVLRSGEQAFDPHRDRPAYEQHLASIGCPTATGEIPVETKGDGGDGALIARWRELAAELAAVMQRLGELGEREHVLQAELEHNQGARNQGAQHAQRDLAELKRTVGQLRRRRRELRCQLDETQAT